MSLPAMSLGLRFCASRKGGTGGGGRVSTLGPGNMAVFLGLAVESPWSVLGGHFSPPVHEWTYKTVFWPCRASISGSEAIFSLCRGDHWPRAVTIASSLDSWCGLSLECVQNGCNGTCVKLEASKLT